MTKLELIVAINDYLMSEHAKLEQEMAEVEGYAENATPSGELFDLCKTIDMAKKSERCMGKQEIILGVLDILANL